jgi:hypothetical protein
MNLAEVSRWRRQETETLCIRLGVVGRAGQKRSPIPAGRPSGLRFKVTYPVRTSVDSEAYERAYGW